MNKKNRIITDRINCDHISSNISALAAMVLKELNPSDPAYKIAKERMKRPIDYMRCAEFYAVSKILSVEPGMNILDAGSPQWFFLSLAKDYPTVNFTYINILKDEIEPFKKISQVCSLQNVTYRQEDIRQLSFRSDIFDKVISISVLEHVSPEEGGDYQALMEIKRVLKYSQDLIITLPYKENRNIVYVEGDVYERAFCTNNFFAREYDEPMFNELITGSDYLLTDVLYITEKKGLLPLDYYTWGPGKSALFFRGILKLKKIFEQVCRVSFDELLAKHYLTAAPIIKYRPVNIAAKLQNCKAGGQ